jgi:hypothetical protein
MRACFLIVAFVALAGLIGTGSSSEDPPAKPDDSARTSPYDAAPRHLWNRLHQALMDRTMTDNPSAEYADDEFEPFPVLHGRPLLTGAGHRRALAVLDEFLSSNGERLFEDPVRHAFMQRNLWSLFDWTADKQWRHVARELQFRDERNALAERLARAMRKLALPPQQNQRLGDNYALAVSRKEFSREFDPAHPEKPFLPPDLWEPEGPWVLLGDQLGTPLARTHLEFFNGRSAFFVFLRLPGGRRQTLAYIEQLEAHRSEQHRATLTHKGPMAPPPQIPVGTQVALVRRLLAIDQRGDIRLTPITEMVQLRVYRRLDYCADAQATFEFRLARRDLFAGKSSGLHVVGDEGDLEFRLFLGRANNPDGTTKIMGSCRHCHGSMGLQSINSFAQATFRDRSGDRPRAMAIEAEKEEGRLVHFKDDFGWGLLQGFWRSSR